MKSIQESKIVVFKPTAIIYDEIDLSNPPVWGGGIPAPKAYIPIPPEDTNGGLGYAVTYSPFDSLGWTYNVADITPIEDGKKYDESFTTRSEAWDAAAAFNHAETARINRNQGR